MSDDHNLAVYDTATYAIVCKGKGDRGAVRDVAFRNEEVFVTTGPRHFKQWTLGASGNFTSKNGNFGKNDARHVGCVFNGDTCLTGSMEGKLYAWQGTSISGQPKKIHERLIEAITVTAQAIFTGGRDSKINILNPKNYALLFSINTNDFPDSICNWPRAIAVSPTMDTLMVGTYGHEIYEVPLDLKNKKSQ